VTALPSHSSPSGPFPITRTLNLGILAHVDAGKTSLTERLLYTTGAIERLGSVDDGDTQTDTGALERERGITIRSAVAAFAAGDGLQVNLVDTPGHPDFIAEVERALAVLDGAVLVLSAVEGVQAQTRVLMRSLRALGLPVLLFVNKIDRSGARDDDLIADIRRRLTPHVLPMSAVRDAGTPGARAVPLHLRRRGVRARAAELLAEDDDALLARLVDGDLPTAGEVRDLIRERTAAGRLHPLYFGSALTGEGVWRLIAGIREFLPPPVRPAGGEPRGTVFAVERAAGGEKVAYLRLFDGEVRERRRLAFRRRDPGGATGGFTARATRVEPVAAPGGPWSPAGERRLAAGGIARVHGLAEVRVGDRLGEEPPGGPGHFAPPSLETVVRPRHPGEEARLHAALTALADEDPLIRTRPAGDGATSVLLYGAVQREVIGERLARDFGIEAAFEPIRPVYVERPVGTGEAVVVLDPRGSNDFWATVGLRVAPAPPGAGVSFTEAVEWGAVPPAFHRAVEETVYATLRQGLSGWEVTDCAVTLVRHGWWAPNSTAADFRGLTPVVLLRALQAAGTRVYEPCQALELHVPPAALAAVSGALASLDGEVVGSEPGDGDGGGWVLRGRLPARLVPDLTAALPGLTGGEGVLWARPGADRPVRGRPPRRARTDGDPLNYPEYLRFLSNRSLARTAREEPAR
jgi:ribosomal protection tetracycline resistance protein